MEADANRRWHPSIRVRVTAVAAAVVAIVLAAGAIALAGFLHRALIRGASGSALQRTAEITALVARRPLPSVLPAVDATRRTVIQVVDPDGRVVAATAPLTGTEPLVTPRPGHNSVKRQPALGPGPWLAQPVAATLNGRVMTVIVYTSVVDVERTMRVFVGLMLVALPAATGFVALVVWSVAGRALRPVEVMRQEVSSITSTSLSRRVPEPPAQDEIARLATTLNDMLARLDAANDRQRQFMADASHELRTPLANIRAAIEVSMAHPSLTDWDELSEDVLRQTARVERLTENLLLLATGDATRSRAAGDLVDLAMLLDRELERSAAGIHVEREGEPGPVLVAGDRDEIARALTNLVDNALRHARQRVTGGLRSGARWAEMWVADDGPGVPAAQRERIFDRFVRLDDHRDRTDGGVGLGLAIARDLVQRNGGTLTLDAHGEGATFRIRLPLAARATTDRAEPSAVS